VWAINLLFKLKLINSRMLVLNNLRTYVDQTIVIYILELQAYLFIGSKY